MSGDAPGQTQPQPVLSRPWLFPALYLATVLLSVGIWLARPHGAFWINDCANKYLLTHNLSMKGFGDFSLEYPARDLDPEITANPLPPPSSVVRNRKIYSICPPIFSFIAAFFYRVLGFNGLMALPLAGALAMALLVRKLALRCGLRHGEASWAGLAAYWCTPCLFYSFCFWEHTISNALVMLAVLALVPCLDGDRAGGLVVSGCVLGLSIGLREEFYLLAAAFLGSLLFSRVGRRRALVLFPAGLLAGLTPVWLFQRWAIGSAFGFHLADNVKGSKAFMLDDPAGIVAERVRVTIELLANISSAGPFNILYIAAFACLVVVALGCKEKSAKRLAVLCAGASLLVAAAGLLLAWSGDGIAAWTRGNGLLMHGALLIPAFAWFLFRGEARINKTARFLARTMMLFVAALCATAPPISAQGIHWGPRLMQPVYPMAVLLIFFASSLVRTKLDAVDGPVSPGPRPPNRTPQPGARPLIPAVCALFLFSLGVQLFSVSLLHRKLAYTWEVASQIRDLPETVVAGDVWWFPLEMAGIFYDKKLMVFRNRTDLSKAISRMQRQGLKSFLFVSNVPGKRAPLYQARSESHLFDISVHRYALE